MSLFFGGRGWEIVFGALFIIWGAVCIVLNKRGGKMYAAFQKGWGLGQSAFSVGRVISVVGGILFMIIGLVMIVVRQL